jgi:alpha-glucosidase
MNKMLYIILLQILLHYSIATAINYTLNNNLLTITNSKNNIPYLTIDISKPFITTQIQQVNTRYHLGSFRFKTKILEQFSINNNISLINDNDKLTLSGNLSNKRNSHTYEIHFSINNDNSLQWNIITHDTNINYIEITFQSKKEEQFYGFGEQYSYLNFKGKKFPVFTEEQGLGRGDAPITFFANLAKAGGNKFTTYCAMAYTLTTAKRALLIENSEYMEFDLKNPAKISVAVRSNNISGRIWTGEAPQKITEQYTAFSGRMPQLPDWAFGTWLGLQGGEQKVKEITKTTLNANNPVTAVWIQDWVGKRETKFGSRLYWNWLPDTNVYPNIKQLCAEMNAQNIKVLAYINPFLADYGPQTEVAIANNYLVKNSIGQYYKIPVGGFNAYMVDLSNPAACSWLKEIIKTNIIDNGFSGWMADFSEWLPFDAKLFSGEKASTYHNQYMVDWAKLNREVIQEAGKENEIIFFNRGGFTGSNKYSTLFWEGDQMVSWQQHDGLPSALKGLLSSGISGISLNHSDIGGYTAVNKLPVKYIRSRELFYRWTEMNVFSIVFRTHEGLLPKNNFQFYNDTEGQQFFARMGRLHFALKDYLKFLNTEATNMGLPIVRTLNFVFPNDINTINIDNQFMLGNELLVAPVLKKNSTNVNVYLPEGEWIHIWSNKEFKGKCNIEINAPIGKPAIFINKQSNWIGRLLQDLQNI